MPGTVAPKERDQKALQHLSDTEGARAQLPLILEGTHASYSTVSLIATWVKAHPNVKSLS